MTLNLTLTLKTFVRFVFVAVVFCFCLNLRGLVHGSILHTFLAGICVNSSRLVRGTGSIFVLSWLVLGRVQVLVGLCIVVFFSLHAGFCVNFGSLTLVHCSTK